MNRSSPIKGFTVFELLVYIALISGFGFALANMLLVINDEQFVTEQNQIEREAVTSFSDTLKNDIRSSTDIQSPSAGSTGSTLTLSVSGDTVVYALSSGTITRTVNGGSPTVLTPENITLSNLEFRNLSSDSAVAFSVTFSIGEELFSTNYTIRDYAALGGGSTQADCLVIDASSANFNNDDLEDVTLENTCDDDITITTVTYSWNDNDIDIEEIEIPDETTVWLHNGVGSPDGRQDSGTEIDITDVVIGDGQTILTEAQFDDDIESGTDFTLLVKLTDGSTKSLNFSPSGGD